MKESKMKELNDPLYIERQKKITELKVIEQSEELKTTFYNLRFGLFNRCPYNIEWSDIGLPHITIRDSRYDSIESMRNRKGAMVARLHPFSRIEVYDKKILDVLRNFGNKWKYEQLIMKWS